MADKVHSPYSSDQAPHETVSERASNGTLPTRHDKGKAEKKAGLSGSWHLNVGELSYRRPPNWTHDTEKGRKHAVKHKYKDQYGHKSEFRDRGLETYLSGTRFKPRELIVQFSNHGFVEKDCQWNRRPISGSVPTAVKISEWTLRPAFDASPDAEKRVRWVGIPMFMLRSLLVAVPLQLYMAFPIFTPPWEQDDADEMYMDWPGHSWKWPKFAVNPLDMSPNSRDLQTIRESAKPRLLRPRMLVVKEGDQWIPRDVRSTHTVCEPYVMISYTNEHFHTEKREEGGAEESSKGRDTLEQIAQLRAEEAGVQAYWIDFQCRTSDKDQTKVDADVNRFCDVVRGASRVVIVLPNEDPKSALDWGNRMWTLPEALLAVGDKLHVHYADSGRKVEFTKVEMAAVMWNDPSKHPDQDDIEATRILAEHYSNVLQLSRIQLMSTALDALMARRRTITPSKSRPWEAAEVAHAWMGLLHTRIDPVEGNTLFQDLAKLSLLNDSDQLVERMVCLLHKDGHADPFGMLAARDTFDTHVWDIHPTCEVVGIDHDDLTVVLNNCRAIPIRWKQFPKLMYRRKFTFRKLLAEIFLRSGAWWYLFAFTLVFTYTPLWISETGGDSDSLNKDKYLGVPAVDWLALAVAFFLGIGTLLSFAGPISIRVLYGGLVLQCTPHLVGFEGTLPIDQLEKIIFGNNADRLSYAAGSTPFSVQWRDKDECVGTEPPWIAHPENNDHFPEHERRPYLKPGNRLFTIVDTGNLSVNVIEAERPPTVALICGREGGMLRSVLCSWDFVKDRLIKETVIRMPTDAFEMAKTKGWLKLRLQRPPPHQVEIEHNHHHFWSQ